MFGYATDETEECMPLTVVLAHKLNEKIAELRRSGELWWARPDTKTQVSKQSNFSSRGFLAPRTVKAEHSLISLPKYRLNHLPLVSTSGLQGELVS